MRRTVLFTTCSFALGLIIGGSSIEVKHLSAGQQEGHLFERKVECSKIAKAYERDNSSGPVTILVDAVDYSPSESSCIASIQQYTGSTENWLIVDLLSGSQDTIGWCDEKRDCGGGKNVELESESRKAFEARTKGTRPPVPKIRIAQP